MKLQQVAERAQVFFSFGHRLGDRHHFFGSPFFVRTRTLRALRRTVPAVATRFVATPGGGRPLPGGCSFLLRGWRALRLPSPVRPILSPAALALLLRRARSL